MPETNQENIDNTQENHIKEAEILGGNRLRGKQPYMWGCSIF